MKIKITKSAIWSVVSAWLPQAFIATAMSGLIYVTIHQNLRMTANDPQVEWSEGITEALASGLDPQNLSGSQPADIAKSLAPFYVIYDESGKPLVSSGLLAGNMPFVPAGVLDYARNHTDDRVTWEPVPKVRIAAVVRYYQSAASKGFVLIGRSLREVEIRETNLLKMITVGWGVTLIGLLVLLILLRVLPNVKVRWPKIRRQS